VDELIVFLMREFGWTLEYAQNLIKHLPLKKLNALVEEVQYQKAVDDYRTAANFASIVGTLASSRQKRYTIENIIGRPPQRRTYKPPDLKTAAKDIGIKMPKEE